MASNFSLESNLLSVVEFDIFAQFPLKHANNHTPIQLLFYLEHIYWYYIDNYAKKDQDNQFPLFTFDEFVKKVAMPHINLPSNPQKIDDLLKKFRLYKNLVPTCGAVILDPSCDYVVMTRAPGSHQWYFPKGKVNNGEAAEDCAVREVNEEVGVNIKKLLNPTEFVQIVRNVKNSANVGVKATASSATLNGQQDMETGENLEDSPQFDEDLAAIDRDIAASGNKQYCILFFVVGLPLSTKFHPHTEDEIEECRWFSLKELHDHIRKVVTTRKQGISIKDEFYFARLVLLKLFDWLKMHKSQPLKRADPTSPVGGSSTRRRHTNSESVKNGRRSLTPVFSQAAGTPSRNKKVSKHRPSADKTTCPKHLKTPVSSFQNRFGTPMATGLLSGSSRPNSAVILNATSDLETSTKSSKLSNSFSGSQIPRVKSESVFLPALDDSEPDASDDVVSPTPSSSNEMSSKATANELLEVDFVAPSSDSDTMCSQLKDSEKTFELATSKSNSTCNLNSTRVLPICNSIPELIRALSNFHASAWPSTNDLSS